MYANQNSHDHTHIQYTIYSIHTHLIYLQSLSLSLSPLPFLSLSLSLSLPPLQLIAILAFSTTEGFSSSGGNNTISCRNSTQNRTYTATVTYQYPYDGDNFNIIPAPNDEFIMNRTTSECRTSIFSRQIFYGSAQYYVAMGVFTMLYVIGALVIYIVFITPDLFMAKYLVIVVSLSLSKYYRADKLGDEVVILSMAAGIAILNLILSMEKKFSILKNAHFSGNGCQSLHIYTL